MKRFLSIILLSVLAFILCFSACGKTDNNDGKNEEQSTVIETDENELPLVPLG